MKIAAKTHIPFDFNLNVEWERDSPYTFIIIVLSLTFFVASFLRSVFSSFSSFLSLFLPLQSTTYVLQFLRNTFYFIFILVKQTHYVYVCMRLIRKWYVKMGMDFWVRRYRFVLFLCVSVTAFRSVCLWKYHHILPGFFSNSLNLMVSIDSGEEKLPRSFCNRFAEIIQKLTHLNTISALQTHTHTHTCREREIVSESNGCWLLHSMNACASDNLEKWQRRTCLKGITCHSNTLIILSLCAHTHPDAFACPSFGPLHVSFCRFQRQFVLLFHSPISRMHFQFFFDPRLNLQFFLSQLFAMAFVVIWFTCAVAFAPEEKFD